MLRTLDRHAKLLSHLATIAWATSCSTYDAALLAEARGTGSSTENVAGGSGGMNTGGADELGTGGRASGGADGTGSTAGSGGGFGGISMGGSGNETSTGGADPGDCPMNDCCPDNPDKDEPGQCGCDEADDDADGDLTADCNDLCPDEPSKTEPGDCGCEVSATDEENCSVIKNGIVHRYSFAGSGDEATDSVGSAHGAIVNGGVQSGGLLTLDGVDQHVSLPAGMISSLNSATFEIWFTWNGGGKYQRLMDFGSTQGDPAGGLTYLYLAASRNNGRPGSAYSLTGDTQTATEGIAALETGALYHFTLVVDGEEGSMNLYLDGTFQSGVAFNQQLSDVDDVYGYLGRSLFAGDPYLDGSIDEFRIYDLPLSAKDIAYSHAQGKDASLFD